MAKSRSLEEGFSGETAPINILHLSLCGTTIHWGGANHHIRSLARGLKGPIQTVVASNKGSSLCQQMREEFPVVELPSASLIDPRNMIVIFKGYKKV